MQPDGSRVDSGVEDTDANIAAIVFRVFGEEFMGVCFVFGEEGLGPFIGGGCRCQGRRRRIADFLEFV